MGRYSSGRVISAACCRQVEALVDRPISEIHFGWSRIYASLDRQPPFGGGFEVDESDDFALADSYTLAGDLTFERSNLDSVRNCFALGRENARQMRHCISAEMWTCLNLAWLRIRELAIEDIWKVSPESFYAQTTREIDTFIGVAEATMYRDEGWRFMRLGRFLERSFWLPCSWLNSTPVERRARSPTRAGQACCARAGHSMPTRRYSVEVRRTGCWTCSSPIPCCPARCTARSIRLRRSSPPSARAPIHAPAPRPSGSPAGCVP